MSEREKEFSCDVQKNVRPDVRGGNEEWARVQQHRYYFGQGEMLSRGCGTVGGAERADDGAQ